MDQKIEITFYTPTEPSATTDGMLVIEKYGQNFLDFKGSFLDPFRVLSIVYANAAESERKFTLVNCVFHSSHGSNYRFTINELYEGAHLPAVTSENCVRASFEASGLTRWINQPRIQPQLTFPIGEHPSNIVVHPSTQRVIQVNANFSLILESYCHGKLHHTGAILQNRSQCIIEVINPVSRLTMTQTVFGFQKLLSLFTQYLPKINMLDFRLTDNVTIKLLNYKKDKKSEEDDPYLDLIQLSDHIQNILTLFYARQKDFEKIVDLLNASTANRTPETSFLNITTALEVFHTKFMAGVDTQVRTGIAAELEAAGIKEPGRINWIQSMRYYHLLKHTQSLELFTKMVTDPIKLVALMKNSRNFYTHYSATSSEIWTPNQLVYSNILLRQLLKAVLLKQLEVPDTLINPLLNKRYAIISHRYDKNEYSMHYLGEDAGAIDHDV